MATRIVVLSAGRSEQVGTPLELFHKPANRLVAGSIGTPNMHFLEATCPGTAPEGVRLRLATGAEISLPVDGAAGEGAPLTLGIRADDLA